MAACQQRADAESRLGSARRSATMARRLRSRLPSRRRGTNGVGANGGRRAGVRMRACSLRDPPLFAEGSTPMTAWSLDHARKTYSIPALVGGLLRCRRAGQDQRRPTRTAGAVDSAAGGHRQGQGAGRQAAVAGALPRHPRRPPAQAAGRVRAGHDRLGLRRRLYRGLPDQGQPARRASPARSPRTMARASAWKPAASRS